jgi:hypothetical protein
MSQTGHGRPIRLGDQHVRRYLACGSAKTRDATPASGQLRTSWAVLSRVFICSVLPAAAFIFQQFDELLV